MKAPPTGQADSSLQQLRRLGGPYLGFLASRFLSVTGDGITQIALPFVVLETTGSVAAVGLVQAARWLPVLLLSLLGGVLADRRSRKRLIMATDAVAAVVVFVLAALLDGDAAIPIPVLLAGSATLGACSALRRPALGGIVIELVESEVTGPAVAWNSTVQSAAMTLGPVLGGAVVALGGSGTALAVDGCTFLFAMVVTSCLTVGTVPAAKAESLWRSAVDGWMFVLRQPWIVTVIGYTALYQFFFLSTVFVLGPISVQEDQGSAARWGLYMTAMGLGSILGAWLPTRRQFRRPVVTVVVALTASPVATVALASGTTSAAVALAFAVTGVLVSVSDTLWRSELTLSVPPTHVSRVLSIDSFGSMLFKPLGQTVAGFVAVVVSTRLAMLAGAGVTVLLGIAVTGALVRSVPTRAVL